MINTTLSAPRSDAAPVKDTKKRHIKAAAYLKRKKLAMRLLAVLAAIPLLPLIGVLIGLVRLTSPGPGIYRQKRIGFKRKPFTIFKLRSMRNDAEKFTGPVWASKNDPRITPIGGFLRVSHLDELPQIFNVIRGDMDFVGPRPERPELMEQLREEVPDIYDRLLAMPGITGLAQVNLPPDQTVDCVRQKLAADCYYIENATLWLDIRLMLATLLRILGIRYHHGAKLLNVTLPSHVLESAMAAAPRRREVYSAELKASPVAFQGGGDAAVGHEERDVDSDASFAAEEGDRLLVARPR